MTRQFQNTLHVGNSTTFKSAALGWLIYGVLLLLLSGCGAPPEIQKKPEPTSPKPEPVPVVKKGPVYDMTIRVASLDLSAPRSFKIEQSHINQLAAILNKDSVDLFSIQGVARYPGLTTRIDIVDAISQATGMSNLFGENINISGRQTGNAVFSRYPFLSHDNAQYDHIQSAGFEAALQAVIDCGSQEVVFVSTQLPVRGPQSDITTCLNKLDSFHSYYAANPIIVSGNLPQDQVNKTYGSYIDTKAGASKGAPRIWYDSKNGAMKLLVIKTLSSPLGTISIADFSLLQK